MQSDLETDNDSGSEEEIRQADAVMVGNAHDDDEDGEMGANSPTYRIEEKNESSCEEEEILLRHKDTSKQFGNVRQSRNNTQSMHDMREIMAEMMVKFQENQKDFMKTVFDNANQNSENVLISLKSMESSMKAISSYIIRDSQTTDTDTICTSTQFSQADKQPPYLADTAAKYVASNNDSTWQREFTALPVSGQTTHNLRSNIIEDNPDKQKNSNHIPIYPRVAITEMRDSSEDRHYGCRALQTPSNTRRSDSDFSNKPQTLRQNPEPAQSSFIHNDNADRHYGLSLPRIPLDTHRSDTDLTNRPQTLRQEPLPAQGPLPYSDSEDRHYGYRAQQNPSNTHRSETGFTNPHQTVREELLPAQGSFLHNNNADRHYGPSVPRFPLDTHRSDTDLTNRPHTLRQEPLPAQGPLPYSDSEDGHYGYRAVQTPSKTRRSDSDFSNKPQTLRQNPEPAQSSFIHNDNADRHYDHSSTRVLLNIHRSGTGLTNRPQTLRQEPLPAQGHLPYSDSEDRHYGYRAQQNPSNTRRSETDFTNRLQTVREEFVPAQGSFLHNDNADRHCGPGILRFPLGTHQSYTDLTIKPQTHKEKTMPGQGPFRHHESADQHLGSDITEHLPDSMIVGELNTCTRPVRPECVSDENDLIHDRSIGGHCGSVLAGNNSDTELLRRRAGKGYQYSTGDHSLYERSSERHCEYDFGKGDQLLSRAGKPRHCSYEVGTNKISIPRPSVNNLIHGDKEKRLNSRKCPEDMVEIETLRENPQSSTKWLGLPITTQPNSVTRQSGAHEKPVKMPAFNGTDS